MIQQTCNTPKKTAGATILLILMLTAVGLGACDSNKIYESNVRIPPEGWKREHRAQFEIDITDATAPYNIYVNVRNNSDYKYMELWLFVNIHTPNETSQRDTLRIMLADHRGKWLGNGLGDKFDTRYYLRKNIRFATVGKYIIEYEQATRDEPLIGIDDVGLRVERVPAEQ